MIDDKTSNDGDDNSYDRCLNLSLIYHGALGVLCMPIPILERHEIRELVMRVDE